MVQSRENSAVYRQNCPDLRRLIIRVYLTQHDYLYSIKNECATSRPFSSSVQGNLPNNTQFFPHSPVPANKVLASKLRAQVEAMLSSWSRHRRKSAPNLVRIAHNALRLRARGRHLMCNPSSFHPSFTGLPTVGENNLGFTTDRIHSDVSAVLQKKRKRYIKTITHCAFHIDTSTSPSKRIVWHAAVLPMCVGSGDGVISATEVSKNVYFEAQERR